MPKSTHVHKSMLLRGVKFPVPALNQNDIETTKGRAAKSGRNHGGVPLRGDGRGRNSFNYSSSNSYSSVPSHQQSYGSQNNHNNPYPGPPGWQPPPPGVSGFARGPPPPPPGSYGSYGRGPSSYQQHPPYNAQSGYGPPSGDRRRGGSDVYGYRGPR
jgi:5'-3' exoribonuclease 2